MAEVQNALYPTPEMEATLKKMNYSLVKQSDMTEEVRGEAPDAMVTGIEKYPTNMEVRRGPSCPAPRTRPAAVGDGSLKAFVLFGRALTAGSFSRWRRS